MRTELCLLLCCGADDLMHYSSSAKLQSQKRIQYDPSFLRINSTKMAAISLRSQSLSLYKSLLRTALKWEASSGVLGDTKSEREYIKTETKELFRKNKQLTDVEEIKLCIQEGESRLTMALHYRTPYPRPVNIPYGGLPPSMSKDKKAQVRLRKQAKPVYMKSHDEY
ncbi:LYR motif-containing protein 1 isoform X1 [Strongylocentrotus purpuratus]|uniref:Complex 1 LYR protein domain-containing protein n=2 Tax=Strongylocentrotus purpuratus TaxID=7668 RepID=A0A7M7RI52_STRPU|nr:LYR motif-containing protein 1 isoform X1 [Strongylocentrotus purpuratus]